MRLIRCTDRQLVEFLGDDIPEYSILSHTWEADEVTYQELINGQGKRKAGYAKITRCCDQALWDGHHYAWVDTCCIDKTSSAELSEAICSMFRWYQKSAVCYAFLADVEEDVNGNTADDAWQRSRWFTRGWTLQELLAPKELIFYDMNMRCIGTKSQKAPFIATIAGINSDVLVNPNTLNHYSVAQRMSWAAMRQSTRLEDRAYSLSGIFAVNMPLLYGEGKKSFLRLQSEILEQSDDCSIFAWRSRPGMSESGGLLAWSTECSEDCGFVRPIARYDFFATSISSTSKGISLGIPVVYTADCSYRASIGCLDTRTNAYLSIKLGKAIDVDGTHIFHRMREESHWLYTAQSHDTTFLQVHRILVASKTQTWRSARTAVLYQHPYGPPAFEVRMSFSAFEADDDIHVTVSFDRRLFLPELFNPLGASSLTHRNHVEFVLTGSHKELLLFRLRPLSLQVLKLRHVSLVMLIKRTSQGDATTVIAVKFKGSAPQPTLTIESAVTSRHIEPEELGSSKDPASHVPELVGRPHVDPLNTPKGLITFSSAFRAAWRLSASDCYSLQSEPTLKHAPAKFGFYRIQVTQDISASVLTDAELFKQLQLILNGLSVHQYVSLCLAIYLLSIDSNLVLYLDLLLLWFCARFALGWTPSRAAFVQGFLEILMKGDRQLTMCSVASCILFWPRDRHFAWRLRFEILRHVGNELAEASGIMGMKPLLLLSMFEFALPPDYARSDSKSLFSIGDGNVVTVVSTIMLSRTPDFINRPGVPRRFMYSLVASSVGSGPRELVRYVAAAWGFDLSDIDAESATFLILDFFVLFSIAMPSPSLAMTVLRSHWLPWTWKASKLWTLAVSLVLLGLYFFMISEATFPLPAIARIQRSRLNSMWEAKRKFES